MSFEYKAVAGPERGKRQRGCRTVSDRVAAAMEEIIRTEAVGGWEYLRTDLVAVEERDGWLSRRRAMHCSVLVFRRPLAAGEDDMPPAPGVRIQPIVQTPRPAHEPVQTGVPVLGRDIGHSMAGQAQPAPTGLFSRGALGRRDGG